MQRASRLFRLALVALWIVLLGDLVWQQRRAPSSPDRPEQDFVPAADAEDTWMGLYMNDRKLGYTHQRLSPEHDGYRFEEESLLHLEVLGHLETVSAVAWGRTGSDFALQSFAMSLHSGVGSLEVEGSLQNHEMRLSMQTGGDASSTNVPMPGPVYLPGNARLYVAHTGLQQGREISVKVFDPSSLDSHDLRVTVAGREPLAVDGRTIDAWRIREEYHGVRSDVWLDPSGRAIREAGPMGLTAVRETGERAVAGLDSAGGLDLSDALAIRVDKPLGDARDLHRLMLRLDGIDDVAVPNDWRQSYDGGVLTIDREGNSTGSFTLPYDGAEWRSDLQRTPFLQVDHPRVVAAAAEILEGETDARRATDRLRSWVFQHLRKVPTASIPNALQVLDMKEGDCNEHAVLLAALARAAGIPARIAAGAVYLDGKFLYHAWNEVWLGSQWVSLDAALDQMPVDATHIKLVEGGPETHAALLPVMGRLKIEVVSAG